MIRRPHVVPLADWERAAGRHRRRRPWRERICANPYLFWGAELGALAAVAALLTYAASGG